MNKRHHLAKAGLATALLALIAATGSLAACQRNEEPDVIVPAPAETPPPEPAPEPTPPPADTTPPAQTPETGAPTPPPAEGTQNPPKDESTPPKY